MKAVGRQGEGHDRLVQLARSATTTCSRWTPTDRLSSSPRARRVDWFPRFSPDGSAHPVRAQQEGLGQRARRQHRGQVGPLHLPGRRQASPRRWSTTPAGAPGSTDDEILFVRGTKIFRAEAGQATTRLLVDSEKVPRPGRGAAAAARRCRTTASSSPSPCAARSARPGSGTSRSKTWTRTGDGCQINWTPDGTPVYWVHPTGNGGSRVFRRSMTKDGKPAKDVSDDDQKLHRPARTALARILPASCRTTAAGWCGRATQRGHDHDIADYEIYLWQVGSPPERRPA